MISLRGANKKFRKQLVHKRGKELFKVRMTCVISQTSRDNKLTIQTLERICSRLHEIPPSLLDSVNLKSLITLVVENLFAEMRQGNEMPLVLQFAYHFSSAVREYIKRITQSSFIYHTSSSSYYSQASWVFTIYSIPFNAETLQKLHSDEATTG